jgi:thiol-disulfide isomerase/thioredoxin
MRPPKSAVALAALALAGCGSPPAGPAPDASVDGGTQASDAGAGLACGASIPTDNFCAAEGCNFRPITLDRCDAGGGTYDFYGPDYCASKLTLLVVFAEWCVPCQEEAPMIQRLITEGYAGRGVRVVSVMAQNLGGEAPTADRCRNWQHAFRLTSHMALDSRGLTQVYFPMMAFPANILVDRRGQIVYRAYGASAGLSELRDAIDTALAAGM